MDLGTYLDAQQRLIAAGYVLTYQQHDQRAGQYLVSATRVGASSAEMLVIGQLSHATCALADYLAAGAR